ncbi:MAG: M28 family peptidase [Bacteroidota bacterium]
MNGHLLFLLSITLLACNQHQQQSSPQPTSKTTAAPVTTPLFDAQQAFKFLTAQTDFGPRNPGSKGHAACLQYLQDQMNTYADAVTVQNFSGTDHKGGRHQLTNVVSSFNLQATDRILLTAHWDTRPWADEDPNPANRTKPILGANDGASGIAVLLEIARLLKEQQPPIGIDMVFFDGEDLGKSGNTDSYCLGSKHFARTKAPGFNPRFAVNLDMVGDALLTIPREPYSDEYAPDVLDLIFSTAHILNAAAFVNRPGTATYDDHIPLNEAKIRAVDLIDFEYPDESNRYWHTMEDTPDQCSPESLAAVGTVLLHIIYSSTSTPSNP